MLAARAASGAAWSYASFATGRLLVFVGLAIVARLVGPEEYGLFAMAAAGIYFLEGSYDFGLIRGLIYFGGDHRRESHAKRLSSAVCLGGAISGALFALAPGIAMFYGEPRVTGLVRALSVYFAIACVGLVPDAILQRQLAFDRRFWPSVAAPAGRYAIASLWPRAATEPGASPGASWSGSASKWCGWPRWLAGSQDSVGHTAAASRLIRFASQVSAVEWIAAIALNLDYVLVGHFLGGASLGLYALAFKLPDTTLGAAGLVGSRVLLPAFMSLDRQRLGIAVLQALRWLTMLLAPAGAGLFVLAPVVVPLVFGEMWSEAVPVVQLLALSSCLNGLLQTVGAGFVAVGQPRKSLPRKLCGWRCWCRPCMSPPRSASSPWRARTCSACLSLEASSWRSQDPPWASAPSRWVARPRLACWQPAPWCWYWYRCFG